MFGIYLKFPADPIEAARTAFYGLYALQHRGQESAGLAVADGQNIRLHKNLGLVSEVVAPEDLGKLTGHIAVGHVGYSSQAEGGIVDAQPLVIHYLRGQLALAQNGSLTNVEELHHSLSVRGSVFQTTTDTEIIANLLASYAQDSLENSLMKCMLDLQGGFTLLLMTEHELIGMRDRKGIRPLCLGQLKGDYVLTSESAALDTIGAEFIRDIEPGEIVIIGEEGLKSIKVPTGGEAPAHCIFEYVYIARPDSTIDGFNVTLSRREFGRQLAREAQVDADIVIPVPDSGTESALGYAEESGLPFQQGLMKNRYVGRTFIQPTQQMRELGVQLKLNPVKDIVGGKRIVMVDDSIVRGTTSKKIVKRLKDAGAREVHVMVTSPPTKYSCFYGVDTSHQEELIAHKMTNAEICEYIGADSLHYISLAGMYAALDASGAKFCAACFDGNYPVSSLRAGKVSDS